MNNIRFIHGDYSIFNSNDNLRFKTSYDMGKLNGIEQAWHPNGQLEWKVQNINGRSKRRIQDLE